jgi:hypothetical protein
VVINYGDRKLAKGFALEHHSVAEHVGLAEHTPHGDVAERSELLTQKLGKAVAGNHAQPLDKAFLRPHGSSITASRTPGMEYGTPG